MAELPEIKDTYTHSQRKKTHTKKFSLDIHEFLCDIHRMSVH